MFSTLIITAFTLSAPPVHAAECRELPFVAIRPIGRSPVKACDKSADRSECQINKGYSRFGKTATGALTIAPDRPLVRDRIKYLEPLRRSPAIREMNELRIRAREMARASDPCEPNYIYIGDDTVFGMGPAYVSSTRFTINGRATTNVIMAEDVRAPYRIPIAMLSKTSLIDAHYYDIVIAHELAHGLMQDLYGVDQFAKLEKRVVTRDGHMASAVTDPTLAWIEGFAEAFETYLSDRYLSPSQQATPYLDSIVKKVTDRMDFFDEHGWGLYALTIPWAIVQSAQTILNMDDFVSDFLKAERLQPIRENHYVTRGPMANLAHKYQIAPTNQADSDALADWEIENDDTVYSKEGIVAHFLYELFSRGHTERVFETIVWARPRSLWDFAQAFREGLEELPAPAQSELERIYKETFLTVGRERVRDRLQTPQTSESARARARFDAARLPEMLPPPRDLWIEFWNTSLFHYQLQGWMDRVNLSTASAGRLKSFLDTIGEHDKQTRENVLRNLVAFRDGDRSKSVEEFAANWRKSARGHMKGPVALTADILLKHRWCFLDRCASHSQP